MSLGPGCVWGGLSFPFLIHLSAPSILTHFGFSFVLSCSPKPFGSSQLPGGQHRCFLILSFTPFLISPPILHNYSHLPIWPLSAVDCDTHPPWAPFTTSMPWFIVLVLPYRHVLVLVLPYKHVPPFYSPLYFYSSVSFWAPSSTTPHLSEWWVTPWHLSRYLSWETRKRQTVWLKFLNMNSKRGSDLQDGNTQQKW